MPVSIISLSSNRLYSTVQPVVGIRELTGIYSLPSKSLGALSSIRCPSPYFASLSPGVYSILTSPIVSLFPCAVPPVIFAISRISIIGYSSTSIAGYAASLPSKLTVISAVPSGMSRIGSYITASQIGTISPEEFHTNIFLSVSSDFSGKSTLYIEFALTSAAFTDTNAPFS